MVKLFGLIGKDIQYSFSKKYFTERFAHTNTENCLYENFDMAHIDEFKTVLSKHPNLCGLNVTIPYKETILPYLDELSNQAKKIGAVNVIRFKNGKLKGYNSDAYGFKKSLKPLLQSHHKKALILGTGGAAKAVAFALEELDIQYSFASRKTNHNTIAYHHINATSFDNFQIWINCTPLGTSPNVNFCPEIPYEYFTTKHLAYDLIYNPEETLFLKKAKKMGAVTKNGSEMLILQAEKSWRIWNK